MNREWAILKHNAYINMKHNDKNNPLFLLGQLESFSSVETYS